MSMIWSLASRNLRLFFRDRASVFYSLLSLIIIMGLYILFLGDTLLRSGIAEELGDNARWFMDSWIMGGLMAVTAITTTMGAIGTMVDDRTRKIRRDFVAAPISRLQLMGGYILSTFIIGMIMIIISFVFAEIYISVYGGQLLSVSLLPKLLGVMLLSVFSGTAFMLLIVSFFKTNNSFATASTILGTLIGFLTGIYIPIGSLPDSIQTVIKIFPPSHSGALFRQIMMEAPIQAAFADVPASVADPIIKEMSLELGVNYAFGDTVLSSWVSVLILIATGVLFFALSVWRLSKKET